MSRKSKKHPDKSRIRKKPCQSGLVIVHGVGDQKPGATSDLVASRVCKTFDAVGVAASQFQIANGDATPFANEISVESSKKLLVVDSHWADIVRNERKTGTLATLQRIWFVLKFLPYLISAAVAPRAHESKRLAQQQLPRRTRTKSPFDKEADDLLEQAPTMWRGITWFTVALIVILTFTWLPIWVVLLTTVLGGTALYFFSRSSRDVVEHIRIAGVGGRELELVLKRIEGSLDYAVGMCDEVWVVGHSQGGYLAHRLLASQEKPSWHSIVRYTGLASGLRPISLIKFVNERRWALAGWLWHLGGVLIAVGVVGFFEPGGVMNTEGERMMIAFVSAFYVQAFAVAANPETIVAINDLLDAAMLHLFPTQWWSVFCAVAGLAVVAIGFILQQKRGGEVPEIGPLPKRVFWEELTSPGDLVGSMSMPGIHRSAHQRTVPSLRQPIGDHLLASYLNPKSIFRFNIARWAASRTPYAQRFQYVNKYEAALNSLADRVYALRLTVQLLFLFIAVVVPVSFGSSLYQMASKVLFAGILVALFSAITAAAWWLIGSSRRIGELVARRGLCKPSSGLSTAGWKRPRQSLYFMLVFVVSSVVAVKGCVILASMLSSVGTADSIQAASGLQAIAGSFMISVLIVLIAACLAIVRLRGVRVALASAGLIIVFGFIATVSVCDPLVRFGLPGALPAIAAVIVLCIAILKSSRYSS